MTMNLRVEAQVSSDELLKAVGQLSTSDLEQFISQVISLQAQRKAPSLPKDEAELLIKINQGLPPDVREQYEALIAKRQSETLTQEEHSELFDLAERVEGLEAERVERLVELAHIRGISFRQLMKTLNIQLSNHA